jgi:DNA repair exonuclease SbcCD nuclease subunit
MADCHLGFRQYNLRERFNDFGRVFLAVIDRAIEERVDFVLLAGDLFHKRSIDALTLNQAVAGLERLQRAGIPCLAVEGNHEHAYIDEVYGWMKFLALRQLLILLDADFVEGKPQLKPYAHRAGSYIEPVPGLRVHGMRYFGAGTAKAIAGYAAALAELPTDGVEYTIFMTHAGIEGEVSEQMSGLSMAEWSPLRDKADYVALGHIHKPFCRDDWLHNPGSLETCTSLETEWSERGFYLVEVDTANAERKHLATLVPAKRRHFVRLSLKCDLLDTPDALYDNARGVMTRRSRDLGIARLGPDDRPVVDVQLFGVLRFERSALEMAKLDALVKEIFAPLHPMIRNQTTSVEGPIGGDETISRAQLERQVLADFFHRDGRFTARSQSWAAAALSLKALALEGADAETLLTDLEERMARMAPDAEEGSDANPRG